MKNVVINTQKAKYLALLGPLWEPGSGKSTLLHMMGRLDTPTSGTVIVWGKNWQRRTTSSLPSSAAAAYLLKTYSASLMHLTLKHTSFFSKIGRVQKMTNEIKFSTVMKANEAIISRFNSIEQCKKANLGNRALNSTDIYNYDFDCNIQQVKRLEFDVLYYGLFFADRIAIFKMHSNEILSCFGYSDKQHKGNEGEGQFHLNRSSIDYHMQNHFVQ